MDCNGVLSRAICTQCQRAIINSVYQENTLSTWSNITFNQTIIPGTSDATDIEFIVPADPSLGVHSGQHFYLGYSAQRSIQYSLASVLEGTVVGASDDLAFGTYGSISSDVLQTLFIQNFTNCDTPDDRLSCAMSNIASAMSKSFRDSAYTSAKAAGFNASASDLHNTANMAVGRTLISQAFVEVHWQWLSLPLLVWVMTVVTWIGTVGLTRRARLANWGNDIIPLLFLYREKHAITEEPQTSDEEDGRPGSSATMHVDFEKKSQHIQAQLRTRPGSVRLVET